MARTISITDGNSHETVMTWDGDCRLLTCTAANGDEMQYTYDGSGQKGLLSETTDGNNHHIYISYNGLNQETGVSYADSTSESWSYSPTGRIAPHTDGNSHTISYSFDHADRLTTATYPDSSTVSWGLDSAGHVTSMTDWTGTTGYTLDAVSRCTQIAAPNGTVGYGYDNADRRTSMTQGSLSWAYSYDAGNRLSTTTSPYSEVTTNSWDAANRLTQVNSGDGSNVWYSYDTSNRVTEVEHTTSTGTMLTDYQYGYDAVNCTSQIDTDGTTTDYGYDAADQLTSEVRDNTHGTGYSVGYTYDHNQNRLTKTLNSVTDSYSYDNQNKLTGVTGSQTKSYGYDSNGNCTSVTVGTGGSAQTTYLSYDYESRVSGITYPSSATNSFKYNGSDLRVQKVDSGGTHNYITDGTTPASDVISDGSAVYTPGLSENRGGTSAFYHPDALGSTRDITNSSQSVTDTRRFDAFGMLMLTSGSNPTAFGYAGAEQYQTDSDSGLMLLGHRYYDNTTGRFLSRDPAYAGTNWYAYCGNNPLVHCDPTGLNMVGPEELDCGNEMGGGGGGGGGEGGIGEIVDEAVEAVEGLFGPPGGGEVGGGGEEGGSGAWAVGESGGLLSPSETIAKAEELGYYPAEGQRPVDWPKVGEIAKSVQEPGFRWPTLNPRDADPVTISRNLDGTISISNGQHRILGGLMGGNPPPPQSIQTFGGGIPVPRQPW